MITHSVCHACRVASTLHSSHQRRRAHTPCCWAAASCGNTFFLCVFLEFVATYRGVASFTVEGDVRGKSHQSPNKSSESVKGYLAGYCAKYRFMHSSRAYNSALVRQHVLETFFESTACKHSREHLHLITLSTQPTRPRLPNPRLGVE